MLQNRLRRFHFSVSKRKRLPEKIPGSREVLSLSEEVTEQEAVLSHPQVDVIIGPFQTGQPGCSSLTDCCAVVKGRMPEDQLVELELALLPEQVLAVAVLKQELKPVL